MAIVFADRVKQRSHVTGTGNITLESTVTGFQSFAAIGNGNETYYGIEDAAGNWEVGLGTYNSAGPVLTRDTVISSSNANLKIDFPDGGKNVFTTIPSTVAANIIASTTYAFKDIEVSGQSTVSADSTTDILTLVAGTNVSITTDALTDTITFNSDTPTALVNGSESLTLNSDGSVSLSGGTTVSDTGTLGTFTPAGATTVVYTSKSSDIRSIRIYAQYQGAEDGGDGADHTHACDIIAIYRQSALSVDTVDGIVYGVVYTSLAPLVTFGVQWNSIAGAIEITATPASATLDGYTKIVATEVETSY